MPEISGDRYGAPFQISLVRPGALAAATDVAGYRAQRNFRVIGVSMFLRTTGATSGSTTVDVNKAGASILSAAMSVAQGAAQKWQEGALGSAARGYPRGVDVLKGELITVDIDAIPGTTSNDLEVFLDCIATDPDK